MNTLLRKARGLLGIALTWGVLWAAIFAALVAVIGVVRPEDIGPGEGAVDVWPVGAAVGLVSGVAFGTLLSLAEGGRAILGITLSRAALWGILGSAAFPLLTGREDMVAVLCPIGATIAIVSLVIARKAELGDSGRPRRLRDVILACALAPIRDAVAPSTEPST